jgi:hypothetical protein
MMILFLGGVCLTTKTLPEVKDMIFNSFKITLTGGLALVLLIGAIVGCFAYSDRLTWEVDRACNMGDTRDINENDIGITVRTDPSLTGD